ncbi:MAG: AAA family ATPase [Chloroflexota bacterium]|nr:AAA family ATPase [Chloroflexota bacterium]
MSDARSPIGRISELESVDRLLDERGGPAALIIAGEAGIGKTTVWGYGVSAAARRGMSVLSAAPGENETALAYAALADLLEVVPEGVVDALPAVQREGLDIALMRADPVSRRIQPGFVAAGFVSVIRALAAKGPLVLAIDDVQWLDAASRDVLRFAMRRLGRQPVMVLLGQRTSDDGPTPLGLRKALTEERVEVVRLRPLTVGALHHVLQERLGQPFGRPTLLRIAEWSGGNPLMAQELGRALLEGGWRLDPAEPPPISTDLAYLLGDRLRGLPRSQQRTLLVAALLERPTTDAVRDGCGGLSWPIIYPNLAKGILEATEPFIRFAHPLFRAQAMGIATDADRRAVHRCLAILESNPEASARHLALAGIPPDEAVACALDAAAAAAAERAAPKAAAELTELACRYTLPEDAEVMQARQTQLGRLLFRTGGRKRAQEVLEVAVGGPAGAGRARALIELARVVQDANDERASALFDRARREPAIGRLLRAEAEIGMGTVAPDNRRSRRHLMAALRLLPAGDDPVLRAKALKNLAIVEADLGNPSFRALLDEALALEAERSTPTVAARAALTRAEQLTGDDELEEARSEFLTLHKIAEQEGDETSLPRILSGLVMIEIRAGDWVRAERLSKERLELSEQLGLAGQVASARAQRAGIAVLRGDPAAARPGLRLALDWAEQSDDVLRRSFGLEILGLLEHSLERHAQAVRAFELAASLWGQLGRLDPGENLVIGDHLEALVAVGDLTRAAEVANEIERLARRLGRRRPLALVDRGRGLVASALGDQDEAVRLLERSVARLDELRIPFEAARSRLILGIVHRRRRKKRMAHDTLEEALEGFSRLGALLWIARTERELARIGLRPSAPTALTETEATVARLAASGRTNQEVAEAAFLSTRSVEGVLRRVYTKLDIGSRAELGRAMAGRQDDGQTAAFTRDR